MHTLEAVAGRCDSVSTGAAVHRRAARLKDTLGGCPLGTEIVTRTLATCTVASVRDTLPSAADEGVLWERLWSGLASAGAVPADDPLLATVYHDDFLLSRNADVEVLVQVAEPFHGTPEVRCRELPSTLVACRQPGPVPEMLTVFDALGRWIARNGYRFAGPMLSVHRSAPGAVPGPQDIVEVCAPVSVLAL